MGGCLGCYWGFLGFMGVQWWRIPGKVERLIGAGETAGGVFGNGRACAPEGAAVRRKEMGLSSWSMRALRDTRGSASKRSRARGWGWT